MVNNMANKRYSSTHKRALANKVKKRKKSNRIGTIIVALFVVAFAVIIGIKVQSSNETLDHLRARENELKEIKEVQEERLKGLEERRIYMQTDMYIEEMAKKLGLMYPNEILLKPGE